MANVGVGGLASFAANLANGYMRGKEHQREIARQEKQDEYQASQQAFQAEQQDVLRKQQERENTLRTGLSNAAAPAQVSENGATLSLADGTKTTYDDADVAGSDYRMIRRTDEATGRQSLGAAPQRTAVMNGKAFGSLADAQAAGKAYDAPEAVASRQAGAYRAAGAPEKAMSLEKYEADKRTTKHNEDTRAIDLANKAWRQKVGQAMFKPGETALSGLTELISESEFGPMKGKKVKDVLSADGKTVVMHVINADGSLTPTGLKFSNDQDGAMRAAYALDMAVTPEQRYENFVAETKNAQQQKKDEKRDAETVRHNKAMEGLEGKRLGDGKSGGSVGRGGGSGGNEGSYKKDSLDVTKAREKRLDLQKRIDTVIKKMENRLITRDEAKMQMQKLELQQAQYDKVIQDAEAPGPAPGPGQAPGLAGARPANALSYSNLWK